MNKQNSIITVLLLGFVFTFLGSTIAYLTWRSDEASKTVIRFTIGNGFSCAADGGGDITSATINLVPTEVNDNTTDNYIKREIKVMPLNNLNKSIYMDLWLDIKSITSGLSNSDNLMYSFTTSSTSPETDVIVSGNFKNKMANDTISLFSEKEYATTITDTYYLWLWLDAAETSPTTMNQTFELSLNGSCVDELQVKEDISPDLKTGLVPIVFDTTGSNTIIKTVSSDNNSWYNYANKEWANAVLVKESGTQTREYYQNTPNVEITSSDILAYYVWIPRYKYKIWTTTTSKEGSETSIDIVFETKGVEKSTGSTTDKYLTHPAFTFGNTEVNGIWIGKFETTGTEASPTILPDNISLVDQTVGTQYLTAKKFSNYGLPSTMDAHMAKGSEWSAASYLSHSIYGVNREIYINNSSKMYTGRSGGNVGGSTTASSIYSNGSALVRYNNYGYYTWNGFLLSYNTNTLSSTRDLTKVASTTGNITGIYDMSGGSHEYLMSYYSGASSTWGSTSGKDRAGFTSTPPSSHYDDYVTDDFLTACNNGPCFGYGTFEVNRWYGDVADFTTKSNPWITAGGDYLSGNLAGAFDFDASDGDANNKTTFRSVLVSTE